MKLNRKIGTGLKSSNQLGCLVRNQKTGHILDTNGICTQLLDTLCRLLPVLESISIAKGIGKSNLRMTAFLLGSLYCGFQVTKVVQTVENTNNINTVCDRFLSEILYYVVSIMIITQNVLTTEQHLKFGIRKAFS